MQCRSTLFEKQERHRSFLDIVKALARLDLLTHLVVKGRMGTTGQLVQHSVANPHGCQLFPRPVVMNIVFKYSSMGMSTLSDLA